MLEIKNLFYKYPGRNKFTLDNINLTLAQGEMVLLAGCSGCGKSTLIKAVAGVLNLSKKEYFSGEIYLDNRSIKLLSADQIGLLVGTVYQTPEDQLFAMNVYDEVAFALENQGMNEVLTKEKVDNILRLVNLQDKACNSIHTLSGGERQRLAVASVLVTEPKLLILDEPVSQMNPQGVSEFLRLLLYLNKKLNITVLLVEHRVNELADYFSRIVVMKNGTMIYDGDMDKVWQYIDDEEFNGIRKPQNIQLCNILKLPVITNNSQSIITQIKEKYILEDITDNKKTADTVTEKKLLEVNNLSFKYSGAENKTLNNISFDLYDGEITALMGFNGAGKSTLLNILGGLESNYSGHINFAGSPFKGKLSDIGYLRQEADLMLLADNVLEEILWGNNIIDKKEAVNFAEKFGLLNYLNDFSLSLSKGQRLRVVLASVLAKRPKLILLDEPTTGQDQQSLNAIKDVLLDYRKQGGCVLFCTHDIELAGEIADKVILMNSGKIIANGKTNIVLSDCEHLSESGLKETTIMSISKALQIPICLKAEDIKQYVR